MVGEVLIPSSKAELSKLSVKGGNANPLQEGGAPTPIK